jgi:signal transduction histidine kinase
MARLRRQGEERGRELERLRELVADREAMARAGELSAGMAHELRNGLGTILGYARLVQQDPAGAAQAAARIRDECAALEQVIKRFSEFVRDERLQAARFDLRRTTERLLARELQARPGAAVELAAGPEAGLVGDEELVERALENLLRNAREAAGPSGRVTLSLARDGGEARVSVADDGPGLSPEVRASLRPFFTTKPGGLGLGLALVAKIAALHGGRLELLDRSPRGLVAALILRDVPVTEGNAA